MQRTFVIGGPFDLRATLGPLLGSSAGLGRLVGAREAWKASRTPDGPVTIRLRAEHDQGDGVRVTASVWGPGAEWAIERAPALVGSGDDPSRFEPRHPLLRALHGRKAGARFGRTDRVMEALVPAVIGQKVTTKEAKRSWRALVRRYSEPAPGPGNLVLPPDPGALAATPYYEFHRMGIERKRAEVIIGCARRARRLEEAALMAPIDAQRRLTALPGIGPWTAAMVLAEALGDADAVPVGDYHIPHTVAWALAGERRGSDERMLELLEPYRPHRGRVIRLLKTSGIGAPRYGPKSPTRDISGI